MAALDLSSFDAALKAHYTDQRVKNMVYRGSPFLAWLPKMERFGGKNLPIPIQYGTPQGRSATFATAKSNKVASKFEDFVLVRKKDYGLASIDNETLEASIGKPNAFMEAASTEINGILRSVKRSLCGALFRDGTGTIGVLSSISGAVITLTNKSDIVNFEVGMSLTSAATSGGTVVGTQDITAVDRSAGTVTLAAGTGFTTTNKYLAVEGDSSAKLSGLAAWLPATAPGGSDSFFGVNRSVDTERLSGVRYDGSAETVEEAIIGACSDIAVAGGETDTVFMNHTNHQQLLKALGSAKEYDSVRASDADISFKAVMMHGPTGPVKILPDRDCPVGTAYALQRDTWKLYSLGAAPKILRSDGLRFLRENSADAVEVRTGYYAQLGCTAPGWNGVITLPA